MPSPENMEENKMEQYKKEFIEFMVESQVLKFGEFTLKSGRKSPFFMNAGAYVTGSQLKRLGEYYAKAIHDNYGLDFDVLFGPAYKGIPLSVVTAIAIHDLYGVEVRYCSNRKEAKDHGGDAGLLLGSKIKDGDRVVIIEDVTTSGKSIEETFPIIQAQGNVEIKGLMVSLNRMERGKGEKCALDEIKELYGFPTAAIQDLAANKSAALVNIDAEHADKLMKQYPYFTKITVPKGTYPGQEEDVNTVAVKCVIVTTDKLSDDLGEQIVKAIYEHLDRMKAAHAVGKYITKDTALEGMSVKMNAGAEKYLKAK